MHLRFLFSSSTMSGNTQKESKSRDPLLSTQAEALFKQVKEELKLGSANATDDAQVLENGVFIRLFCEFLIRGFAIPVFVKGKTSNQELMIFTQMFTSIFATAFQCGSCVEHAALVFVKSLESCIPESKEIIQLEANKESKAKYTSHNVAVLNRENDSSWNNIILIDTWREGQLRIYSPDESPKMCDLAAGLFEPETIECVLKVKHRLKGSDWKKYASLLQELKVCICLETFFNEFQPDDPRWKASFNFLKTQKKEYEGAIHKVHELIDLKIKTYQIFGDYLDELENLKMVLLKLKGHTYITHGGKKIIHGKVYSKSAALFVNDIEAFVTKNINCNDYDFETIKAEEAACRTLLNKIFSVLNSKKEATKWNCLCVGLFGKLGNRDKTTGALHTEVVTLLEKTQNKTTRFVS